MQTQACQISELRNVIEMKSSADDNKLKTISKNIEFNVTKTVEDYLIRHEREHKKRLEAFIAERYSLTELTYTFADILSDHSFSSDKQNRDLRDAISHSVAQFITTQMTDRLTGIIVNQIPRHVVPVIHNQLEALKVQILADVGQKLRNCDQVIKESIMNVTSGKVFFAHYKK